MGNITGANSILQAGIANWNVSSPTVNTNINFTSESLTFNVNRTDEGNLMAKKAALPADVTSMNTSGSVSTILRPSMIDWLMQAVMNQAPDAGSDDNFGPYYEYKLCPSTISGGPKHSTLELSRGGQMRKYSDVVVNSLTLTATAQDYVKADFDITGGAETKITQMTTVNPVTEKSFKCTHARLYAATDETNWTTPTQDLSLGTCPLYSVTSDLPNYFDVSETTITIDTGMVETPALYCSGMYPSQPSIGQRSITVNFTLPYSADIENFYQTYYANENAPELALKLSFTAPKYNNGSISEVECELVEIILPYVQINTYSGNVDGVDLINSSISGNALSNPANTTPSTDNPIIVRHWTNFPIA